MNINIMSWDLNEYIVVILLQTTYDDIIIRLWILEIKNGPLFEREDSRCSCAIGSTGSCGHIVGLLFSLAHMKVSDLKAIPSGVAKTSLPRTWHIPSGKNCVKTCIWLFFFYIRWHESLYFKNFVIDMKSYICISVLLLLLFFL